MVGMIDLQTRYDTLYSDHQRLIELYANQQVCIEKLVLNGNKSCEGTTTITYEFPLIDFEDKISDSEPRKHVRDLRMLRKSRGLTMKELATRLDVTASALGKWEIGMNDPSMPRLEQWAEALGAHVTVTVTKLAE